MCIARPGGRERRNFMSQMNILRSALLAALILAAPAWG
jgi:hypothetical protein